MNVIDFFIKILSTESITPNDGGLMKMMEEYLPKYKSIYMDKEGVKNLFLYRRFGDGDHLCFAGHVDVVPSGEGWQSNPFEPMIRDGDIYARGAQDMKSGVAAFMQALKDIDEFKGTLSVLLTSDEEGDAIYGTKIMLEHLSQIDMLPDYCVVAEPTCEERFGDAIKIGRRGSINGYLTILGKQGHAAYPEKVINPVHQIAPLLEQLAGVDLDSGDDDFEPSKIVITDIRGGIEVVNVTPNSLRIMFNIRNSTNTTQEDVKDHIDRVLCGLDYKLRLKQGSYPFVTDRKSKIVEHISRSIESITNIKPKLSTAGGTSDARFMGQYGIDVIEFGVINDTIHAPNERTSIAEVEALNKVFSRLLEEF